MVVEIPIIYRVLYTIQTVGMGMGFLKQSIVWTLMKNLQHWAKAKVPMPNQKTNAYEQETSYTPPPRRKKKTHVTLF